MEKESKFIEYKREFTSGLKKEIIAFANTMGGTIYIGISDNGEIFGVSDPDLEMRKIISMVNDAIKPDITMFVNVETIIIKEKEVVKISVNQGTNKPYFIGEKGLKSSGVYIRMGSSSIQASNDTIRKMIKLADKDKFEDELSLNQDLNFDYTENEFLKNNLEIKEPQMITLGLMTIDGLYNNLGLLFSNQCKHSIKVAVFDGLDKEMFLDKREFSGSLLQQLNESFEYLNLHNKTKSYINGLKREDTRDYPEWSIREALLNAVIHRDYSYSGSILINIFDNRLEIVSLGGLVENISLNDIMKNISQTRNEKLAHIFYKLGLVEAYGTGISRIFSSYKKNGNLLPVFESTDNAFIVTLPNVNFIDKKEFEIAKIYNLNNMTSKTELDKYVTSMEEKICKYIKENESITRKKAEEILDISQTASGKFLRNMKEKGLILSVGNGKNIKYIIK